MIRRTLENLLTAASIPDVHKHTELLLSRYHTLDGVFCADAIDLTNLVGERGAMIIKLTAATVCRRAEEHLLPGTHYNEAVMREHLVGFFCGSAIELLYLISNNISIDRLFDGIETKSVVAVSTIGVRNEKDLFNKEISYTS